MATLTTAPEIKEIEYTSDNTPNAGKMIYAMRHLGYENAAAIEDLVDNAIDANATYISVRVFTEKGKPRIIIADNGYGMSEDTLREAMKLGSDTVRDETSDLGKFGMGLSTASLSLAKKTTVITRKDGATTTSITDVDAITKQNAFVKYLEDATVEENRLLETELADATACAGTVILLDNCDGLTTQNTSALSERLRSELGRVFRKFINGDRVIAVNGRLVNASDPLAWDSPNTTRRIDTKFNVVDACDKEQTVSVRLVILTKDSESESQEEANQRNQGLYILRNNREISHALWLGLEPVHNDLNYIRGELSFDGSLNESMGVTFKKDSVNTKQSVRDKVGAIIVPELKQIRDAAKLARAVEASEEDKAAHEQAAKEINAKKKLLLGPDSLKGKRERNEDSKPRDPNAKRNGGEHLHLNRTQVSDKKLNCEFLYEKMGVTGQIWEAEVMSSKLVIRYNIEHPFYQRYIGNQNTEQKIVVDFLVYSLASAETALYQDGEAEVVDKFKTMTSHNLRALLN
jgi:anti-sigma regulatory factor (Ser/Thr protein kinase)